GRGTRRRGGAGAVVVGWGWGAWRLGWRGVVSVRFRTGRQPAAVAGGSVRVDTQSQPSSGTGWVEGQCLSQSRSDLLFSTLQSTNSRLRPKPANGRGSQTPPRTDGHSGDTPT